jgi:hypothetical protein
MRSDGNREIDRLDRRFHHGAGAKDQRQLVGMSVPQIDQYLRKCIVLSPLTPPWHLAVLGNHDGWYNFDKVVAKWPDELAALRDENDAVAQEGTATMVRLRIFSAKIDVKVVPPRPGASRWSRSAIRFVRGVDPLRTFSPAHGG